MELRDHQTEFNTLLLVAQYPELTDDLFSKLSRSDFTHQHALTIWDYYQQLSTKGEYPGSAKLTLYLKGKNIDITRIPINEYLVKSEFDAFVQQLKNLSTRRNILEAVSNIRQQAVDPDEEPAEIAGKAEELILKATEERAGLREWRDIGEILGEFHGEFLAQQEHGKPKGLMTGYPSIDGALQGLCRGHLTVIAADTNIGKSAFALNIIVNIAKRGDYKIGFISLEMEDREYAPRIVAMNGPLPMDMYNRKLSETENKNFNQSINDLYEKRISFIDERGLTVEQLKAKARRKSREIGGFDLLVIDYLQMIKLDNTKYNLAYEIGNIVLEIRNLAQELNCPIVLISQLARSKEDENRNPKPSLNKLRDSGKIEEIADEVLLLWRDKSEDEDIAGAEVNIAKARTGRTFRAPFLWYSDYLYFADEKTVERYGCLKNGRWR